MRRAGVSGRRLVVVYDAGSSVAAARGWWLLRYYGHRDVVVLNGGLAAWTAAGRPVEAGAVLPEPGDFAAAAGGMPLLDAAGAARVAERGVLFDARAPERFGGESEPVDPVAGHIPGAVNVPGSELLDARGRFLAPARLRERFQVAGLDSGGPPAGRHGAGGPDGGGVAPGAIEVGAIEVGAYCGSGVSAAHEVLALELAGYRAALYVGSWSEWIRDPGRPVARGPGGQARAGARS